MLVLKLKKYSLKIVIIQKDNQTKQAASENKMLHNISALHSKQNPCAKQKFDISG